MNKAQNGVCVAIDGCQVACARKSLEQAGFAPVVEVVTVPVTHRMRYRRS